MVSQLHKLNKLVGSFVTSFLMFGYYILKFLHFNILFNRVKKKINNGETDLLFSSFLMNWRSSYFKDGTCDGSDLMFGNVIAQSKKKFNVKCIDRDTKNHFRSKQDTYSKFNKSDDWICIEQFMSITDIFTSFAIFIKYSFGYSIDKEFENYFNITRREIDVNILLRLIISQNILSINQPKVLFLTCEYCNFQKELAYISHLKNIPVIALQHGEITDTHSGYIYQDNCFQSLLPDITCVFGQKYYELLTKESIYNSWQVVVTGSPRYDILYYTDKLYSKEKFIQKYNISAYNQIILWATQCHGISEEENKKNFKAMFETLQNLKDVTLIIKQHPGEGNKYTKMIKDALKYYNLNILITPKSSDIYEQLYVCDIMVTKNSTTAMEAVTLNKPVIVLNLSGEPDVVGYVTEGVALGVYNEKYLKPTIEKLLKDDSELAENRNKYIETYLYNIDGKSTERVLKIIECTINKWQDNKS